MSQEQLEDFVIQRRLEIFEQEKLKGLTSKEDFRLLPSSALQEYK